MIYHLVLVISAAFLQHAHSQFITPPTDLTSATGYAGVDIRYKEVPTGICELNSSVKSYSGFADVGEDDHIFFWFFEARDVDPCEAPLTIWINGGPGSSSMIGLFSENGPCRMNADGTAPIDNPFSWSKYSNMLFIDQPATTGLSYTKTVPGYFDEDYNFFELQTNNCPQNQTGKCGTFSDPNVSLVPNSTMAAALGFWSTLQGFMGVFPQYARNGVHFSTESYGGHYGPVFNDYIEEQNANLPAGAQEIHLESVLIGNGWYDALIQYPAYYNFTVSPGNTYDYTPYNETSENELYNVVYGPGNCVDQLNDCAATGNSTTCRNADRYCSTNVEGFFDRVANRDEYDIRELSPDPFPTGNYEGYLNSPAVQQAIGAVVNYTDGSNIVGTAFESTGDDSREDGTIEKMKKLISSGLNVVMYTGDADYNCNWVGGEAVAQLINAPGFANAGYADLITSDNVIHGAVKQSGKFSFVRVFESGHEVPFYQPLAALEIFHRAITGMDIETGTKVVDAGYVSQGTPISTYREGNSTMQWTVLPANATYNTTTNGPNPLV